MVSAIHPFTSQCVKVMNFIATIVSTDMTSFTQTRTHTITLNLDEYSVIPTHGWLNLKEHVHRAPLDDFVRQKTGVFWTNLCITVRVGSKVTMVFAGNEWYCTIRRRYRYCFILVNRMWFVPWADLSNISSWFWTITKLFFISSVASLFISVHLRPIVWWRSRFPSKNISQSRRFSLYVNETSG